MWAHMYCMDAAADMIIITPSLTLLNIQSMAAAPALLRGLSFAGLHLHRHRHRQVAFRILAQQIPTWRWSSSSSSESTIPEENEPSSTVKNTETSSAVGYSPDFGRMDNPDFGKWKAKEVEILNDIRAVVLLAKDILHSDRYVDGARLTAEDEKEIVEKLLAYHPHCEDKIGCGLDSIMVDRHPQFKNTRCLFVIRTDGAWIDFSYQKCIREYIRHKYPTHGEKFIRQYFKRSD